MQLNQIYNLDAFEFVKSIEPNSIDLVLIDPPYAISRKTNFWDTGSKPGNPRFKRVAFDFGEWDKEEFDMKGLLPLLYKTLKEHGSIVIFYDLWKITTLRESMEAANFKQIRFAEWIKTNPIPLNVNLNYLTNAREAIITGVKGTKPTFNSSYDKGIYSYKIYQEPDRFHPTQKPIKLINDLILKHSNENDIVLDCFSGSGTTAISCLETKRNYICCELNEEYYKKSIERIEDWKQKQSVNLFE